MTGQWAVGSGQWAPACPVAECFPKRQKTCPSTKRSLIPAGVICLVLSNQQITSNQSAVGLFMLHVCRLVIPARWVPRHLAFPSRPPALLNTRDNRSTYTPYWNTGSVARLQIPRCTPSIISTTALLPDMQDLLTMNTKNCQNA